MANSNSKYIKNVAIVGATGTVGHQTFKSLLETEKFNITIITRPTTTITNPSTTHENAFTAVKIYKGSYDDKEFLVASLKGVEVLILALGFTAVGPYQVGIIEAAIEAGVEWFLPTEYGGDSENPAIQKITDCLQNKTPSRESIERLGGKWIGIITGLWLDLIIKGNMIGINIRNQTATLYDNGTTPFSSTNVPLIGTAVANLLSFPITSPDPAAIPTLFSYANKFIHIRSFNTTQLAILQSIQHHTSTTDSDWGITHASASEFVEQGKEKGFRGEMRGWAEAYLGMCLLEGGGGNFEEKAVKEMRELGLVGQEEDLDEWVGKALE